MLYWFRTPPGVKVGRSALDENAIRLLEELNPAVQFDWTRILKGEGREEPRRPEIRRREPARRPASTPPAPPVRFPRPVPELLGEDEHGLEEPEVAPDAVEAPSAAHARLGAEGVLRLRARYAELRARLNERVTSAELLEQLNDRVERLNPDTWVTADEVTAGLEQYEAVFEELRAALGPRRRRRRGGRGQDTAPSDQPTDGADVTDAVTPDRESDGEPDGGGSDGGTQGDGSPV